MSWTTARRSYFVQICVVLTLAALYADVSTAAGISNVRIILGGATGDINVPDTDGDPTNSSASTTGAAGAGFTIEPLDPSMPIGIGMASGNSASLTLTNVLIQATADSIFGNLKIEGLWMHDALTNPSLTVQADGDLQLLGNEGSSYLFTNALLGVSDLEGANVTKYSDDFTNFSLDSTTSSTPSLPAGFTTVSGVFGFTLPKAGDRIYLPDSLVVTVVVPEPTGLACALMGLVGWCLALWRSAPLQRKLSS